VWVKGVLDHARRPKFIGFSERFEGMRLQCIEGYRVRGSVLGGIPNDEADCPRPDLPQAGLPLALLCVPKRALIVLANFLI
jgi:hypothetical protein